MPRTVSSSAPQPWPGAACVSACTTTTTGTARPSSIPSDLILFGTPADNVLLLDQLRAEIFPRGFTIPPTGKAASIHTRSPFVGEFDALNIIAPDTVGVDAAVQFITAPARAATR